jgi:hypothetical protein
MSLRIDFAESRLITAVLIHITALPQCEVIDPFSGIGKHETNSLKAASNAITTFGPENAQHNTLSDVRI